jgi:hypothetical protein
VTVKILGYGHGPFATLTMGLRDNKDVGRLLSGNGVELHLRSYHVDNDIHTCTLILDLNEEALTNLIALLSQDFSRKQEQSTIAMLFELFIRSGVFRRKVEFCYVSERPSLANLIAQMDERKICTFADLLTQVHQGRPFFRLDEEEIRAVVEVFMLLLSWSAFKDLANDQNRHLIYDMFKHQTEFANYLRAAYKNKRLHEICMQVR